MTFPKPSLPDLILFLDYLVTRNLSAQISLFSLERQGRSVSDELGRKQQKVFSGRYCENLLQTLVVTVIPRAEKPTRHRKSKSDECQPFDKEVLLLRFHTILNGISYVTKAAKRFYLYQIIRNAQNDKSLACQTQKPIKEHKRKRSSPIHLTEV